MSWRPDNWKNPHTEEYAKNMGYPDSPYEEVYEAGADAMLEAVIKWLKGYHMGTVPRLDRHNRPAPEFEFVIPEKDLKEMEEK